jgi:hypothetical protein
MSVKVQFTAIRANAAKIPGPAVYAALHEYTQGYCAEIIMRTSEYPPPVPPRSESGTGYQRTFRLLKNWRLKDVSSGAGIQYQITNPVQDRWGRYYSGYVHGPSGQTSFHAAHGWKNIADEIDRPAFKAGAQATLLEVVR